jgi:hypothetical protein
MGDAVNFRESLLFLCLSLSLFFLVVVVVVVVVVSRLHDIWNADAIYW